MATAKNNDNAESLNGEIKGRQLQLEQIQLDALMSAVCCNIMLSWKQLILFDRNNGQISSIYINLSKWVHLRPTELHIDGISDAAISK